jgi:drug/metabolite transporter (DMT)-like permease
VGALSVNRTRLLFAIGLLGATHWAVYGAPLPLQASPSHWLWLGLSGVVGLALGDTFLFQALVDLGPRKAMLVMSSWPIYSALLAFLFLDESLSWREGAGILLTVAGIAWVVLERGAATSGPVRRERLARGVACAFGGAVCQAGGLVLAKEGLSSGLPALSGTLVRMIAAAAVIWLLTLFMGGVRQNFAKFKDKRALLFTTCGAVTGPFVGVWMSLYAVNHAKVAVASALMSLVPILLIPLMWLLFRETVSKRALLGTLAAFAGVLVLLLR